MAASRSVQKELADLKRDLTAHRSDYARIKHRAATTKADGVDRYSALTDGLSGTVSAFAAVKDKIADRTESAVDGISDHLNDLRDVVDDYSDMARKTVVAHSFAVLVGAAAAGYLIARLSR